MSFEALSRQQISLARLEVGDLSGIACPSASVCTAVDAGGHELTFDPASPGEPPAPMIDGAVGLTALACPAEGQCTAVDAGGHEVSFDPASPGTPSAVAIDGGVELTGVACPTTEQCTAVDHGGHEVTFEPKSGTVNPLSTTIGAGPTPSKAKSSIFVTPIPTLLTGLAGSATLEVTVTLESESGEPVPEDLVTLNIEGRYGSLREGISEDPKSTDEAGRATFTFRCEPGYCSPGDLLKVSASDETGLSLGPVSDPVGYIAFAGKSYSGQTDTLEIEDLGGAETETGEQPVTLSLNGVLVESLSPCTTNASGSLPAVGELGACMFIVPEIEFPDGESPPAEVPGLVKVGSRAFEVSFPLQPTPSISLTPTSGLERSTISVDGSGFARDGSVTVDFTPAGAGSPSASTECQTEGAGEIINNEPIGKHYACKFAVPADTATGGASVSVVGYPTATTTFTVEAPTLVGIALDSHLPGNTGGRGGNLYVGETADLEIIGDYNTGTTKPLEVGGGEPAPEVGWATAPTPAEAIEIDGLHGDVIGLTAKERTKAAGVLKVTYDDTHSDEQFEAETDPIAVKGKACEHCTFVDGALLNVTALIPGFPSAKPLAGAIANITQGVGSAGVFTLPPPCIPENGGCKGSGYPELEEAATETCTTEAGGLCQLIAGEGTEGVATEIEDTVTLTPPAGYAVSGIGSGCTSKSGLGLSETPVCHLKLGELSEPQSITFEVKPLPELKVQVGGPEVFLFDWVNEDLNGAVATILPIDGTPGEAVKCTVEGGEEEYVLNGEFFGERANCAKVVAPGSYEVLVGPKVTTGAGKYYVTSTDPKVVKVEAGERGTADFNTAVDQETEVTVKVGGPEVELFDWANGDLDGAVASIIPTAGTTGAAVECTIKGGEDEDVLLNPLIGEQASCSKAVAPGSYEVRVGPEVTTLEGSYRVTSEDPKVVSVKAGEDAPASFNTATVGSFPYGGSASASSSEASSPAVASAGSLKATANGGTGTVLVGRYESDPVSALAFGSAERYADVYVAPGSSFMEVIFRDCELNEGTSLSWFNQAADGGKGEWQTVSTQSYEAGSPPCITATIDEETSPKLSQLSGTVFGVAHPPVSETSTASTATAMSTSTTTATSPRLPGPTAASGSVSLAGSRLAVNGNGEVSVKLTCAGTGGCRGTLTLSAKISTGRGKKKHARAQVIGGGSFSIPAGRTVTVALKLNSGGRALLSGAHGDLDAALAILKASPAPSATHSDPVRLVERKAKKAKKATK